MNSSAPAYGILAVGAATPAQTITNAHYAAQLDTTEDWIESRTGIQQRRHATADETSSSLGLKAAENLAARYPGVLGGVDLVICATSSPDAMFPSTAALIAGQLGLAGAAAFDISVACSGFVYALSVAHGMLSAGTAKRALVIGAETMSRVVDQQDRNTAILFGDGAGAVVLGEVASGGIQAFELGADSRGAKDLFLRGLAEGLPSGESMGQYLTQNGREVFKFAVRILGDAAQKTMQKAGKTPNDIDWLIPHQANIRIIEAACERLRLPLERVIINLERYGNTSAASVPLALAEAAQQGRIKQGQQLLLCGFGGGLSWAACALEWSLE